MTTTEQSYASAPQLKENFKKYQNTFAFIGLVFLALLVAGYFIYGAQIFLRAYLVGFWFWFGTGAGCLLLLMTQYLTGGAWGVMIRRPLEAGAKTLRVMWFGFLPLLIGVHQLYWWSTPAGQADPRIHFKHYYLNVEFLWIRWLIYGVIWLGSLGLLAHWSRLEDETKSTKYSRRLEILSGPGVVAYFFTMTFASVDFLMTLEPHWFSTMYGFMIVMGQAFSAMGLVVAALVTCAKFAPLDRTLTKTHLHDLGKLLLAIVMLWAYVNFGQLLITWSGNLPDEVVWYVKRWNGGWGWIGVILLVFHFCFPFALLLSQSLKRSLRTIWLIAVFIVAIHFVDVLALVEPNFVDLNNVRFTMSWLDIAAGIGFGGLWLALFFRYLALWPLLPVGAPDFKKALDHGRAH